MPYRSRGAHWTYTEGIEIERKEQEEEIERVRESAREEEKTRVFLRT